MKSSSVGILCAGSFLITASISLAVISVFSVLLLLDWVFEDYIFLEISAFHPGFKISWHIFLHHNFLLSFCISVVSVVISPLSFLIVFIWILFLFFLMSLLKGLSILFSFSKNQLLDSLILRIVLLVSMSFKSALILLISFLLVALGCLCCCSLSSYRHRVRLFVWNVSLFLR